MAEGEHTEERTGGAAKKGNYKNPFLRGIIAEQATDVDYLYYTQDKRAKGKSHFSIGKYYDFAICGIVNMSKNLPRRLLCFGLIMAALSVGEFLFGFIPAVLKHTLNDVSTALVVRLIFFAVSTGLVFNSFMFEFIISLTNSNNCEELVTEEKRINY